jgi:hypothetical protein
MYAFLFVGGLCVVTNGQPTFPGPWEDPTVIAHYFAVRPLAATICAALQFGSAIPLGLFTATAASRYRFHGLTAAGPTIAMVGGTATVGTLLVSTSILWSIAFPGMARDETLTYALYRLSFALGGPGFSVPFGILVLGIAIPGGLSGLLPRWLFLLGLAIGVVGELSWLDLFFPQALFLVPLTRFLGFGWLVLVGLRLPARPIHNGDNDAA